MANKVIKLSDRSWKEVFSHDEYGTLLQVFFNTATHEIEIVQSTLEGKSIRTCLDTVNSVGLVDKLVESQRSAVGERRPVNVNLDPIGTGNSWVANDGPQEIA